MVINLFGKRDAAAAQTHLPRINDLNDAHIILCLDVGALESKFTDIPGKSTNK